MHQFQFSVQVSGELFKAYYRGEVNKVQVRDLYGRELWINCRYFRPYMSYDGLYGRFLLTLDEHGQFISLTRLSTNP